MKVMKCAIAVAVAILLVIVRQESYPEAAASELYWGDVGAHKIQRANVDGTAIQDVIWTGDANSPQGLALDLTSGRLYWSQDGPDTGIRRANLDGTGQEVIVNDAADTSAIALDTVNGKLYWAGWTQFGLWRANLDGTAIEKLSDYPLPSSGGLAIDSAGGKLYFSVWGWDGGWVGRAGLDGSGIEPLVMDLGGPSGMALDLTRGKMYWVSRRYGTVQRANLDGSNVETQVTGLGTPGTIAVDGSSGKIYWTDFGTGKVQRANVDGTNIEDVVTGLLLPVAIALAEIPVCSPPVVTDASVSPSTLWPPDHRMVDVSVGYGITSNCPTSCTLDVASNESPDAMADGNATPDWIVVNPNWVRLRAERTAAGTGRIYSVTIACTDSVGQSSNASVTVRVPHDQRE